MKKKLLVLAAAGALTAATAVPALALENEFHGSFTTFYNLSNFSATGVLADDAPTQNYFVERMRLGYTAKASDQVKLVSRFEFDYRFWGNSAYNTRPDGSGTTRDGGGAVGADTVNMETKNIYLELDYPVVNAKIGMMANNDAFKGLLFDADMAGVLLAHNYTNAGVSVGYFRLNDSNDGDAIGKNNNDLFLLEGKYNLTKTTKIGAGYYYIVDDSTVNTPANAAANGLGTTFGRGASVHTVGLNAEGVIGPVTLNALAMKQFGDFNEDADAKGLAVNVGARVALGGGTLRSEFLFVDGGDHAWYIPGGIAGTEGGQFYDSEMTMLGRNKYATGIDNAIIYDVNNFGEGVIMGTVGYDYAFNDKLSGSANLGFAAVADDENARGVDRGDSDYLGTEVNAEVNYQLTSNVTLGARGGYLFLGDYFADGFDDPYDLKVLVRYTF
jgi:hypothetical protein